MGEKSAVVKELFYIYQRSDRWLLCDGKEDKENHIFQARTRIEVCLRSTYFKIRIKRLNGAALTFL